MNINSKKPTKSKLSKSLIQKKETLKKKTKLLLLKPCKMTLLARNFKIIDLQM